MWSKQLHEMKLEEAKLKNYDYQDYNDDDDHDNDNDNDENDYGHYEADQEAIFKKLRMDELKKKYGLENHSHELIKKNQSLQDALTLRDELIASNLRDLHVRNTFCHLF